MRTRGLQRLYRHGHPDDDAPHVLDISEHAGDQMIATNDRPEMDQTAEHDRWRIGGQGRFD